MNEANVRKLIAAKIAETGSLRKLALLWSISPAMLSDVMNGRRAPGPKVLVNLGMIRVNRVDYIPQSMSVK